MLVKYFNGDVKPEFKVKSELIDKALLTVKEVMHKFGPDHVSSVCHVKEFGFYPKEKGEKRGGKGEKSRKKTRVRKKRRH